MSSRQMWSTAMSSTLLIIILSILFAGVLSLGLGEWIVRRDRGGARDRSPPG